MNEQANQNEKILTPQEILSLAALFSTKILGGRNLYMNIGADQQLAVKYNLDGSILFTDSNNNQISMDSDGNFYTINNSTIEFPNNIQVNDIRWECHPDNLVNRQPGQTFSDGKVAEMLNSYNQLFARVIEESGLYNHDFTRILAEVDRQILTGYIGKDFNTGGYTLLPATNYLQNLLGNQEIEALIVNRYPPGKFQLPIINGNPIGQVIAISPNQNYHCEISHNGNTTPNISLISIPQGGYLNRLVDASRTHHYIDSDAQICRVVAINEQNIELETPTGRILIAQLGLAKSGYMPVQESNEPELLNLFENAERQKSLYELAEGLVSQGISFRPADEVYIALSNFKPVQTHPNHTYIETLNTASSTFPTSQAPTGHIDSSIGIHLSKNKHINLRNTSQGLITETIVPVTYPEFFRIIHLLTSNALEPIPNDNSNIFYRNKPSSKTIVLLPTLPINPGADIIGASIVPEIQNATYYKDPTSAPIVYVPIETETMQLANTPALLKEIMEAILTRGNSLQRDFFGQIEQIALSDLKNQLRKARSSSNPDLLSMTPDDYYEFARSFHILRERGQTNLVLNYLVKSLNLLSKKFGINHNMSIEMLRNKMLIFGGKYTPRLTDPFYIHSFEQPGRIASFGKSMSAMYLTTFTDGVNGIRSTVDIEVTEEGISIIDQNIPNPIITLYNLTRVLTSQSGSIQNHNNIHHAIVIQGKDNDLFLNPNDCVYTVIDENNFVTTEHKIRRKGKEGNYKYFTVDDTGAEEQLNLIDEVDIQKELMFRYINGEISIKLNPNNEFILENNKPPYKKTNLTWDQLRILTRQIEFIANQESRNRLIVECAEILEKYYKIKRPGNQPSIATVLSDELKNKVVNNTQPTEARIANIQTDGTRLLLDIVIPDIIGTPGYYTNTIVVDLDSKTLQIHETKDGNPDEIESNELILTIIREMMLSNNLSLNRQEIEKLYTQIENRKNNIWIHNPDANMIAVRTNNNQVVVYDRNNPIRKFVFDAHTYSYNTIASQYESPTTHAERRFILQTIIEEVLEDFSMVKGYDQEDKNFMLEKIIAILNKERDLIKQHEVANKNSLLMKLGLFPRKDLYKSPDPLFLDKILSLMIFLGMDQNKDTLQKILSNQILKIPGLLTKGTIVLPDDNGQAWGVECDNVLIVDATNDNGDNFVVVGPATGKCNSKTVPRRGIAYALAQNKNGEYELQMVRGDVIYHNQEYIVHQNTNLRHTDFMGKYGGNKQARGLFQEILLNDTLGSLIADENDIEKLIILAEMYGFDTLNWKQKIDLIKLLVDEIMKPFNNPHTERYKEHVELIID